MATIEAKGLTEEEVREAVENALKFKNQSPSEREERLGTLLLKAVGKYVRDNREFAAALYQFIIETHPDVSKDI